MPKCDTEDLKKLFRNARDQETIADNSKESYTFKKPNEGKAAALDDGYDNFLEKYHNLNENTILAYAPKDLVYHFREVSRRNGFSYVIANMKRDVGLFKTALKRYNAWEICLMIEFIFESGQEYIAKDTVQPTIIISSMCNSIFADAVKWHNDEYVPSVKKISAPHMRLREERFTTENDVGTRKAKIGEWGDEND